MKDEEIAFFKAARENQVSSVRSYLEQGVSINTVNTYNETALIVATKAQSTSVIKALLEDENIDLHVQGFLRGTALTYSIFNDDEASAELLLAREQVFNNAEHPSALNWAVVHENYTLLKLLYQKGANMDLPGLTGLNLIPDWVFKPEPESDTIPFHREYHLDLVHTPFCLAILDKNSEMVNFLLTECRANPNQPDYDGSLPLQIAVDDNNEKMVVLLLAQGANPELPVRVEDEVIPFHRGRRPPTNPKITAMLSCAKEERSSRSSISAASSASLFGGSGTQITFPPRLLEPFKDIFEAAWMDFAEADIPDIERNILKHTIEEGVLSVQEFIELVKALQIPDLLMTSLYILYCSAHQQGIAHLLPQKKSARALPTRSATFLLLQHGQQVLLCKRPPVGIWGGLWSLPEIAGQPEKKTIKSYCQQQLHISISDYQALEPFRHTFSHYHLEIFPVLIAVKKMPIRIMEAAQQIWYNPREPESIGLPKPVQLLMRAIT